MPICSGRMGFLILTFLENLDIIYKKKKKKENTDMSNEAKIAALEIRIKLLEARNKDNGNIVKALKREVRALRAA